MNRNEKSLLLYLETCAVDHAGRVNPLRMNEEDMEIIKKWTKEGIINFGRICSEDINSQGSLWVTLPEETFNLAHMERKARSVHMWEKRYYKTTSEKRG